MNLWGPLERRYSTEMPRRLLALDGGGIRGILTLEVLAEIERQLKELTGAGDGFRLCHFFDYIAGTSTGAIIAAGLARGKSVRELIDFYLDLGPQIFVKASLLRRLTRFYKKGPLEERLRDTFGEETQLFPSDLECLLLVVARNVTTDSPWPISSNPAARYNDPSRRDCNLRIPLWQLVRASTAAPIYFPPEVIQWDPKNPNKTFVFVDGGVTPYNNPAFLLYRMATVPGYNLGWARGESRLMLVSVGTGSAPTLDGDVLSPSKNAASTLVGLPGALMYGSLVDQDINCRTVGRCVAGGIIDSELGDMIPGEPLDVDLGRHFLYARYNAELDDKGLAELGLGHLDAKRLGKLDAVDQIGNLAEVGRRVGKEKVRMEAFRRFV